MSTRSHGHNNSRNKGKAHGQSHGRTAQAKGRSHQGHRFIPLAIRAQKHLSGLDYPVTRQAIVDKAREEGAEPDILKALESLPDREYDGPNGISKELGGEEKDKVSH